MAKYDVRVRYVLEGTYMVVAEGHDEARRTVPEGYGLVLSGSIRTTFDDEDADWNFGVHPDTQILSVAQGNGKGASVSTDFSGRVEELRAGIIEAIRQLLQAHCMTEIRFPEGDGYDPVWMIWFSRNGDLYKCMVTRLRVTKNSLIVSAEERESGYGVECHSPFELGTRNIDWPHETYDAAWGQLEGEKGVEPEAEKS